MTAALNNTRITPRITQSRLSVFMVPPHLQIQPTTDSVVLQYLLWENICIYVDVHSSNSSCLNQQHFKVSTQTIMSPIHKGSLIYFFPICISLFFMSYCIHQIFHYSVKRERLEWHAWQENFEFHTIKCDVSVSFSQICFIKWRNFFSIMVGF